MSGYNENARPGGEHLTTKEITQWLVEGPIPAAEDHMESCSACRAELAKAKSPLMDFRTALMNWSESQPPTPASAVQRMRQNEFRLWDLRHWLPAAALALATVLLVGFVIGPRLFHEKQALTAGKSTVADSDAVLMDQVDAEVSEAVPDAMAPLTDLVAWDSTEQPIETVKPQKHPQHKKSTAAQGSKARSSD